MQMTFKAFKIPVFDGIQFNIGGLTMAIQHSYNNFDILNIIFFVKMTLYYIWWWFSQSLKCTLTFIMSWNVNKWNAIN